MSQGLVVSAPQSGAGKTMLTLGILRALRRRGIGLRSAKSGPDYIDPQFHAAATGSPCVTLDSWAMAPDQIRALADGTDDLLVVEGAMGLYDGAPAADTPFGRGSTADVAAILGLPVVLVLDVAKQGQTAASVVLGLDRFRDDVDIAGVILNRAGSERHAGMIARAVADLGYPVFGWIPRLKDLETPSRHLGLVQAHEREDLEHFLETAAGIAEEHLDIDAFLKVARPVAAGGTAAPLEPLGQRIAVARDDAFSFIYPHLLDGWRACGAELSFFSPLDDQGPGEVDAVYLPGGYPELHAGFLSGRHGFRDGMQAAVERGAAVFGECGGFMVLGRGLTLARGERHPMLGLLPVETSLESPRLHLGYRKLVPQDETPWSGGLTAHEFHYASLTHTDDGAQPLFRAWDSLENDLGPIGARQGRVMGSFVHLIAKA